MKVTVKTVATGRVLTVFPKWYPGQVVHLENLTAEDGVLPEARGWSAVYKGERIAKAIKTRKAAVEFATDFLAANVPGPDTFAGTELR